MHDTNEDEAQQKTRRTNGVRIILIILNAIVCGVVGAVIGLIAGTYYGGNFAGSYEIYGLFGVLVGLSLGSMGGALLASRLLRK